MRQLSFGFLLLLIVTGCGGGGSSPIAGTVWLEHQSLSDATKFADSVSIRFQTSSGATVSIVEKTSILESHRFENVSENVESLQVDYFQNGAPMQTVHVSVDMSDGEERVRFSGNPIGRVRLIANDDGYQLTSNGLPIFIKGVGFDYTQLDQSSPGEWFAYVNPAITQVGANCIRLYGIPWASGGVSTPGSPAYQAQFTSQMLAFAAANDMYVLVGIYADAATTNSSVTQFVQLIQADPNFSQVIGYCVGNEVGQGNFSLVNTLVASVKSQMTQPDLVRPVMTALPAVSAGYVGTIESLLPNIDWLGINTFYGRFDSSHAGGGYLNTQAESLHTGGWTKPWAITEYYSYDMHAPDMPMQVLNGAAIGYMLECNSTLNAINYANSYALYIASADAKSKGSVGGFMLNFGPPHNSKLVASWLEAWAYTGAFTPFVNPPWNNGANQFLRFQAVDAVAQLYGGSFSNPCPQIVLGTDLDPQGISCSFKATLQSAGTPQAGGSQVSASVTATDAETLTFAWYLIGGTSAGFSGDITAPGLDPQAYETSTTIYIGAGTPTVNPNGSITNTIDFALPTPQQSGQNNYQLRVIVFDPSGGAATAVVGFPMQ